MMNTTEIFFVALPYVALISLVFGVLYRYNAVGFEVTSLSSQFLESRLLFWGSQLLHWGLLIVFLGHVLAFALPGTLLAWNGAPWRLLVLELTLFAFALCVLAGLAVLVYRRIVDARVRTVTTPTDAVVYALLLLQVLSGLGIAAAHTWGSSWFASSLTPYMRSIFVLDPQTATVASMPFLVKLHVTTAFLIFAILPYTRLIHFVVFPLNYLWRSYQVVIWNWNPRSIRREGRQFPGVRSTNG